MTSALQLFQGRFGRVALLDSDQDLVPHTHPQCHVLIKARGADTRFAVGDALHPLSAETMVLVNAWQAHAKVHGEAGGRSTVLALYIEPAWLASVQANLGVSGSRGFFPQACVRMPHEVRALADRLIAGMESAADSRTRWELILHELMMSVIWRFSAWRERASLQRLGMDAPRDPRIERAIVFMTENPGARVSIAALARTCGLSRPHFFHLFRECTSVAPAMYLNTLRMESAFSRLPMTGNAGVTSINRLAETLGFSEPQHFTRFFRQNLGIPPSEYRRRVELFA